MLDRMRRLYNGNIDGIKYSPTVENWIVDEGNRPIGYTLEGDFGTTSKGFMYQEGVWSQRVDNAMTTYNPLKDASESPNIFSAVVAHLQMLEQFATDHEGISFSDFKNIIFESIEKLPR